DWHEHHGGKCRGPPVELWEQHTTSTSCSHCHDTSQCRGWRSAGRPAHADPRQERIRMTLLRIEIGDALRTARRRQGRTLREVSSDARVSLGYLSEIERGQKEASSELLASICGALEMPVSILLRDVSDRF